MKVLVVEDEPTSLKLEHVILACEGHHVRDAEGSEKALALIKEEKPAIILLDLGLPGMDGLALARKLKSDPETSDISIIAVTGYPDSYRRDDAIAAGCDAYLVKPVSPRSLPHEVAHAAAKLPGKPALP